MSYDTWLEAPYQEAAEGSSDFVDWCEGENIDPEEPGAQRRYDDAQIADLEDAMIARWEARQEQEDDDRNFQEEC